jgi:hypothetical protein
VENPQFELPLKGQLLHLTDRPVGGTRTGPIGIEIEDDAPAVGASAELGDLLTTERRAQRSHRIGDAGSVKGDDVEVSLHPNSTIGFANRLGGPIQSKQVRALFQTPSFPVN